MVSLTEVKENKPSPAEVDKAISEAINDAEASAKEVEEKIAEEINAAESQAEADLETELGPGATIIIKTEQSEGGETDDDNESNNDDSDSEDDFDSNETLQERVEALKDIMSPEQRQLIVGSISSTKNAIISLSHKTGTLLWYLTTTGLVLGVPLALSILHETQLTELEKEMNLQQSSNDILAPGASSASGNDETKK
ncbi:hypothetical protein FOA43_004124 [Brettanomyces nanus]|uniref:Uncharacterized protein n=1 Tax=Eeniella nana TaxID=13502 RepID=A0A875RQE9_EENNA|nr:uncharacterized protein FOA43_004124 [Brettanomyces nanus]QPG76730.1 hypothetical protein FOA43_004124 [Brettanomyces nanus]